MKKKATAVLVGAILLGLLWITFVEGIPVRSSLYAGGGLWYAYQLDDPDDVHRVNVIMGGTRSQKLFRRFAFKGTLLVEDLEWIDPDFTFIPYTDSSVSFSMKNNAPIYRTGDGEQHLAGYYHCDETCRFLEIPVPGEESIVVSPGSPVPFGQARALIDSRK